MLPLHAVARVFFFPYEPKYIELRVFFSREMNQAVLEMAASSKIMEDNLVEEDWSIKQYENCGRSDHRGCRRCVAEGNTDLLSWLRCAPVFPMPLLGL